MKYTIYACELISDNYFEKVRKEGIKTDLVKAKQLAKTLNKEQKEDRRKGWSFVYIFHLVYEENGFLAK